MKCMHQTHSHFLRFLKLTRLVATKSYKAQIHFHLTQKNRKLNSSLNKKNAVLQSHLQSKRGIFLFRQMQRRHPSSIDTFSFLLVLKACTNTSSLIEGKQIHARIINLGFGSLVFLQTSLVSMYSSTGKLLDARRVFDETSQRNVVSWTAIISAYVNNGKPSGALSLFRRMQRENVQPDRITVTITLSACADVGALETGEWIHAYIRRNISLKPDLCLNNALVNMYAKCGDIETACQLFDQMTERDITTWTSMIVGHAVHGQAEEALGLFSEMKKCDDFWPNEVTFVGVLMACSHGGLVEEGWYHLESMNKLYGLKPRICHYGCIVDLLGRAGLLKEAYEFIGKMPIKPNAVIWRTLLGACRLHGEVELGARIRHHLLELEPCYVGDDIAMSNLYASAGLWGEKETTRKRISRRRIPGCSSIEVEGKVQEFVVGDKRHPMKNEIYWALDGMLKNLMVSGYNPEAANLIDTQHED